jgi:hypothetical protein
MCSARHKRHKRLRPPRSATSDGPHDARRAQGASSSFPLTRLQRAAELLDDLNGLDNVAVRVEHDAP